MKQNKKYFGNAVQAILDTAIEKYCIHNDEAITDIVNLLNVAADMACMYDLYEDNDVYSTCEKINALLLNDDSKYRIISNSSTYFKVSTIV